METLNDRNDLLYHIGKSKIIISTLYENRNIKFDKIKKTNKLNYKVDKTNYTVNLYSKDSQQKSIDIFFNAIKFTLLE